MLVPWLLLTLALLALGVPLWAGYGMHWAGLGVGLGVVFLLVGQRGRWPLSARVSVALCLPLLGHGLALAGWLLSENSPFPFAATETNPPSQPRISFMPRGGTASISPLFPNIPRAPLSMRGTSLDSMGGPQERELEPSGNIGALLAATFALTKKGKETAFATTADGSLKQFTYPDFQLQATYQLDQPAYRAVLDGRRGLLWVAASAPEALRVSRRGDRPSGRGDLHLYDVRALSGSNQTETVLHPRRILSLDANVAELLADPDHRRLFYLAQTDRAVHLGRIDADKEELDAKLPLPPETFALCLTADGKTLYAAGAGLVSVIDADTLRVRRSIEVEGDIWSVAADNEGHVFVARQGQWTDVTLLDLTSPERIDHTWSATLHGRVYLKLSTDQYRLYASSSSVISNRIEGLLVRGHNRIPPPQIGVTKLTDRQPVGGEFFLSPDGQFLVSCRGPVFHLAKAATILLNGQPQSVPPLGIPSRPPG